MDTLTKEFIEILKQLDIEQLKIIRTIVYEAYNDTETQAQGEIA